jgi:hypothetical protein
MGNGLASMKAQGFQMGMFANLVDPANDFDAAIEEMFSDVYRGKHLT